MTAILLDRMAYEVVRDEIEWPPRDVLIHGDRTFLRRPDRDDPARPHEKIYVECTFGIITVTR